VTVGDFSCPSSWLIVSEQAGGDGKKDAAELNWGSRKNIENAREHLR
jgi:hypothetical protein